jgi:hypothetical protein
MKIDIYVELYLWNRDIDPLVRVLQRLEPFSILVKQEMKLYEVRLEEIRATFNADFAEAMATRERVDERRFKRHRAPWEQKKTHREVNSSRH